MVSEELVAGLKNAIERGYSLEQARQSFISAGYSYEEVEAASRFVSTGILAQEQPITTQPTAQITTEQETQVQQTETIQEATKIAKPKEPTTKIRRNFKIILLIVILMILIVIFILTLLFKDKIIGWFA